MKWLQRWFTHMFGNQYMAIAKKNPNTIIQSYGVVSDSRS